MSSSTRRGRRRGARLDAAITGAEHLPLPSGQTVGDLLPSWRLAAETGLDYADELQELATVARGSRRDSVAHLAIHYLRLRVPHSGGYTITVTLSGAASTSADARLVYRLANAVAGQPTTLRSLQGRLAADRRTLIFTVPARVCRSPCFEAPLLVISNGGAVESIRYRVAAN